MSRIMPRIATQGISTAAVSSSVRSGNTLAPEYAALLVGRARREETRTLFTTQTHSRTPRIPSTRSIDSVVMPELGRAASSLAPIRVPVLPSLSSSSTPSAPLSAPAAGHFILAANPSNVEPASLLTSVQAMHCVDPQRRSSSPTTPQTGILSSLVESLQGALAQPEVARS